MHRRPTTTQLAVLTLCLAGITACGDDSSTGPGGSAGLGGTVASGGAITGGTGGGPSAGGTSGDQGGGTGGAAPSGGTGGDLTGGNGGTQSGGTGGATGGSSTGGSAGGGTGGCIDVCGLYGPPCCVWSEACIEPGNSCVVDVLSTRVDTIYDYADLEQEIASIPQDVLVSFTDADIVWAAAEPPPASRIEMHMTPQASSLHGTVLEDAWLHPFRFSCDGQDLFVGVIYEMIGAAAIQTPVLHVARDAENSVVLSLGAFQGAWIVSTAMGPPGARERIDRPELRAAFCQRGALQELDVASD
jgi:hypothetical protein